MKKILLVGATLAALVALTIVVDRMSTKDGKPLVKAADTPAPAPEVTFKDLDGKDVTLAQYKGKVVLVNFWATWCGPCRVEIPWLIEFQQKYGPRGFTVLGVAMDDDTRSAVGTGGGGLRDRGAVRQGEGGAGGGGAGADHGRGRDGGQPAGGVDHDVASHGFFLP